MSENMLTNSNQSLIFTRRLAESTSVVVESTLYLNAEERTRSRYRRETPEGNTITLRLPRGTVLKDGDLLQAETGKIIRIVAQPEPVLTVTGKTPLDLLRAAYHLGNRHVSLEVAPTYLRLSPDSVLQSMLENLGVEITAEVVPFHPEIGVYHQH